MQLTIHPQSNVRLPELIKLQFDQKGQAELRLCIRAKASLENLNYSVLEGHSDLKKYTITIAPFGAFKPQPLPSGALQPQALTSTCDSNQAIHLFIERGEGKSDAYADRLTLLLAAE